TSERAARVQRFGRRISQGWFGLTIGNAFGAMFAAIVASWLQRFSLSQLLLHWLWAAVGAPIHGIFARLFGESLASVDAWFGWYTGNHFKLSFWFFYLTAFCDDFGLPNLKTLGRFLWRRFRGRPACSSTEKPPQPTGDGGALPIS